MKVLTFLKYYEPGYTSGGPIRTIANLVERLGDEFQFTIVTSHADPRDPEPYRAVTVDRFQRVGKAYVFYASPARLSWRKLRALIAGIDHDVLYLNSFVALDFTIKPLVLRGLGLIPKRPVIVAPRGELSPNALAIKRAQKRPYIAAAKASGLYDGVVWQASSTYEEAQVREQFGAASRVLIAPDLLENVPLHELPSSGRPKEPGRLRVVFLARIARMKNLDGALRMLAGLNEHVEFDIYGTLEDEAYWAECQRLVSTLPANITVRYRGPVAPEEVRATMAGYDLFFMPTHGENFGHAVIEAMAAGCPVLISNLTPWRHLEREGVGWDVPVEDVDGFRVVLKRCVEMDAHTHARLSASARRYALGVMDDPRAVEQNRVLFQSTQRGCLPRSNVNENMLRATPQQVA